MTRDPLLMCAWGNCTNTMIASRPGMKVTVTISNAGDIQDRRSFCCEKHASLWLNEQNARMRGVVLSVPVPAVPGANPVTWARAFLAINPTSETLTEEILVTWFGNALRRGYEIGLTQEKHND